MRRQPVAVRPQHMEEGTQLGCECSTLACTTDERTNHLFKLHNVRVHQAAVVEDFTLHILGHLRSRHHSEQCELACLQCGSAQTWLGRCRGCTNGANIVLSAKIDAPTCLLAALDELAGNELACLLVPRQLNKPKSAAIEVPYLWCAEKSYV